jgi:hypothetical protein
LRVHIQDGNEDLPTIDQRHGNKWLLKKIRGYTIQIADTLVALTTNYQSAALYLELKGTASNGRITHTLEGREQLVAPTGRDVWRSTAL